MFLFFGHLQTSKVSILVSLNNKLSICRLEIYVVCKAVVVLKNIMYGVLPTSFPFPNTQIHTPILSKPQPNLNLNTTVGFDMKMTLQTPQYKLRLLTI